jgi:predicted MFS family arabinose efflux permease
VASTRTTTAPAAAPHPPQRPGRRAPGATPLTLTAAPVISYADRFGFLPLVAVAATGLAVPGHTIAAAVSVYFLLYGLAQPVIGVLSDRYGRVVVLRCALAGLALADLVAGLAPGPGVLIAARAVAGAASGALLPTTLVYLGDTVEFQFRQRAVARVLAAAALGAGVAMAAAGLLGRWASWRVLLLAIAALAPVIAAGMRGLPEPPKASAPPTIRQVLRGSPALAAVLVFALLEGAAMLGFFPLFAPALQAHGASSAAAGLVVGVYGGATAGGSWLLGRLHPRLIPRLPLITGGAAMVAGYLTAAIAQTTWTVLAASALLGVSFALFHSTFQTWATQLLPAARGVVTSLFVSAVFTGAAAGTAWASGLESRHAFAALFTVAAALAGVVAVTGTVVRLHSHPPAA